jgi:methionyl-tRNA formyltransferase
MNLCKPYVPKLGRKDGFLDWSRPAKELECLVRAFHPWPGTSADLGLKKNEGFFRRQKLAKVRASLVNYSEVGG